MQITYIKPTRVLDPTMISQVNRSSAQAQASGKGPGLADRVLDIARQHVGFREGSGNANPFSRSFGRPGEPWCADFVSYCKYGLERFDRIARGS